MSRATKLLQAGATGKANGLGERLRVRRGDSGDQPGQGPGLGIPEQPAGPAGGSSLRLRFHLKRSERGRPPCVEEDKWKCPEARD